MPNTNYAKIKTSTTLEYPPERVKSGNTYYSPAPDWWCTQNGYKEVFDTPEPDPEEGYYWTYEWTEDEKYINKVWTKHEVVEPQPTEEEVHITESEDGILEIADIIGNMEGITVTASNALVKIYVRKITDGEINGATQAAWEIDDVPTRWREKVREELENA